MAVHDNYVRVVVESPEQLRLWLEKHGDTEPGAWLQRVKKSSDPTRYVSQPQVARELLCFGWIDGLMRSLDADRSLLMVTPRRKGSIWSAVNKRFVSELEAAGLMHPAGRAVIERAKEDGSWTILDDIEALVVPEDLGAALEEQGLGQAWETWPKSAKKGVLWSLKSAKRAPTRARRLAKALAHLTDGTRPG